jgi:hypothetical protein
VLRRLAILLLLLLQMGTPAYSQFVHARGTEIAGRTFKKFVPLPRSRKHDFRNPLHRRLTAGRTEDDIIIHYTIFKCCAGTGAPSPLGKTYAI